MYVFFIVLIVIVSILLTIAVLLQNSKGGGLASNFTAGNQTFGVRQAADLLEKSTWWLAAIVVVLSIASVVVIPGRSVTTSSVTDQLKDKPAPAGIEFPMGNQGNPLPAETIPAENVPVEQAPAE